MHDSCVVKTLGPRPEIRRRALHEELDQAFPLVLRQGPFRQHQQVDVTIGTGAASHRRPEQVQAKHPPGLWALRWSRKVLLARCTRTSVLGVLRGRDGFRTSPSAA